MTTRRSLLAGAAFAGVAGVLAGCESNPPDSTRRSPAAPDLLLAEGDTGLIMVRGSAGHQIGSAVYTPDAGTVFVTLPDGDANTVLETLDTATMQTRTRVGLPGRWQPRITSPDGTIVALTAPGEARQAGREQTTILVADPSGKLAVVNTADLTVTKVVAIPTGTGGAGSAVSPDGAKLYLGGDSRVHVIELVSFAVEKAWNVGRAVHGLAVSKDGQRLLVGYPGGVGWRQAGSGLEQGHLAVPGLTQLLRVV
jgi:DNA-binding beta-propeller fold protein YncE